MFNAFLSSWFVRRSELAWAFRVVHTFAQCMLGPQLLALTPWVWEQLPVTTHNNETFGCNPERKPCPIFRSCFRKRHFVQPESLKIRVISRSNATVPTNSVITSGCVHLKRLQHQQVTLTVLELSIVHLKLQYCDDLTDCSELLVACQLNHTSILNHTHCGSVTDYSLNDLAKFCSRN